MAGESRCGMDMGQRKEDMKSVNGGAFQCIMRGEGRHGRDKPPHPTLRSLTSLHRTALPHVTVWALRVQAGKDL